MSATAGPAHCPHCNQNPFHLFIQRVARCSLSVRMACNPSALLFIKHAVRFFSATQWRIFIEIGRHGVRSGLSSWMRKTCFQAAMSASMAIGCNPQTNRFLFSFLYEALSLLRMFIKIPFKGLRPWIHPVFCSLLFGISFFNKICNI